MPADTHPFESTVISIANGTFNGTDAKKEEHLAHIKDCFDDCKPIYDRTSKPLDEGHNRGILGSFMHGLKISFKAGRGRQRTLRPRGGYKILESKEDNPWIV